MYSRADLAYTHRHAMDAYTSYTSEIRVSACGRDWILTRPADLETLWEKMTDDEFGEDERLPYWVELWPASVPLAEFLHRKKTDLTGRVCLDMGCGLGLTAITASADGARVIGMDYEEAALGYARRNAALNRVCQPLWTVMDWRRPAVLPRSAAYIWGGDIMYERRFVSPVLDFLEYALAPGGIVWMAEPNRDVYQHFRGSLATRGWAARRAETGEINALYMQPKKVPVTLWELRRGNQ